MILAQKIQSVKVVFCIVLVFLFSSTAIEATDQQEKLDSPFSVLEEDIYKYKCPYCFKKPPANKLNNNIVDERLSERPIKRLGEYVDIFKKIKSIVTIQVSYPTLN